MFGRSVSIRHSLLALKISAVVVAVTLAGSSTPALARGWWWYHSSSSGSTQNSSGYTPPSTSSPPVSNPSPSSVPEIDAGAAAAGLALLVGTVLLLRDRALAR